MIRYIYGTDFAPHAALRDGMHRDRAFQFRDRLKWDVTVDDKGWEADDYDTLNPLYVVWEPSPGVHGGSMRFLPMSGRTMVNDHFAHLMSGPITSPLIWECTRFCLSRSAPSAVAGALMLGGGEIMRNFGVRHFVGVFDKRMIRIYRAIGSSPEVLGTEGEGRDQINVGLWDFTPDRYDTVAKRAGIAPELSRLWFDRSFGGAEVTEPMALTG